MSTTTGELVKLSDGSFGVEFPANNQIYEGDYVYVRTPRRTYEVQVSASRGTRGDKEVFGIVTKPRRLLNLDWD